MEDGPGLVDEPREDAFSSFAPWVKESLSDRFGGTWIDREGPEPVACIAVVDPTERDRQRAEDFASDAGWSVRIQAVRYSQSQLDTFFEMAHATFAEMPTEALLSIGQDPTRNRIEVELTREAPELVERLKSLIPADALSIRVSPGSRFEGLSGGVEIR